MPRSNELIGIEVKNARELAKKLKKYPKEVRDAATNDVGHYLLKVFQEQPPGGNPKGITRKQAFGKTFFSDKQRKWFFANLREGNLRIPYKRTQKFRKSWQLIGRGEDQILVNDAPAGPYLMEKGSQSRMMKKIGWKVIPDIMKERAERIEKVLDASIKKGMKKAGFKN